MADLATLQNALVNADKAGDVPAAQALAAEIQRMQAPAPRQQPPRSILDRWGGAIGEAAGSLITGSVAAPVAGIAGMIGGVLPGPQGQSSEFVRKTQDALTLAPRSEEGGKVLDVATKPFQWIEKGAHKAGEVVAEKTGSPMLGAGVNTALQMAPALFAKGSGAMGERGLATDRLARLKEDAARLKSQESVKMQTLDEGRKAGYVVPPADSVLRGIAGKQAIRQEAVMRNQAVTDALARKAVELPPDAPLTVGALRTKREQLSDPYRQIAGIDREAAETLEKLKDARAEATGWYKAYQNPNQANPTVLRKAQRAEAKANSLEQYLEDIATNSGRADLLPKLKDARVKIAKTYAVERALNIGDGTVSAHVIGNMLDRGAPLTGELATIGKFDQAFRKYTADASTTEAPGGGALAPHAAATLGVLGHAGGVGWWPAGVAMLGGPTRSLLLSDLYQAPKTYGLGMTPSVLSAVEQNPALLAIIQGQQGEKR